MGGNTDEVRYTLKERIVYARAVWDQYQKGRPEWPLRTQLKTIVALILGRHATYDEYLRSSSDIAQAYINDGQAWYDRETGIQCRAFEAVYLCDGLTFAVNSETNEP